MQCTTGNHIIHTLPFVSLFRQLYQLLSYLLFFFNVMYGIIMCMLRIFGVVIFTCVMLFRLDWDIYMRGLEGWDTGNVYVYFDLATEPSFVNSMHVCVST